MNPIQKNVKSTKSRQDTINQTQSHFLVPSEKLDKVTRRVIAPYAQIERKGLKEDEEKADRYLDMNRFNVFLEDTVDLESLLYETAMVLKTVTDSSGVFVYIVDKLKNEIVLMHPDTENPDRHEINMTIRKFPFFVFDNDPANFGSIHYLALPKTLVHAKILRYF